MNNNIPNEITTKIIESFNKAGSANINTLQQVRDVQVVLGSLLQHETKRLEKKLGKKNLRVQQVQASIKCNQTITRDLEVELEIAKIRVPEVDSKDSLIHGRIVDENRRGWVNLVVYFADVRGNIIHPLGKAKTEVSGYYALPMQAETIKEAAESIKEGVLVVVCNSKGELIYRHKDPVMLVGGDRHLVEIVLKRSDLTPPPCDTPSVPIQVLSLDSPTQLTVNQAGTFTGTVNKDATQPLNYRWDFGDNSTASTLTATHSYTKPGDYTVTFVASNQNSTDRQSKTVTVLEQAAPPLIENLTANSRNPQVDTPVYLNAIVQGDAPVSYSWDFGDGTTSLDTAPSHIYQQPGTYNVTVTVANAGGVNKRSLSLTVSQLPTDVWVARGRVVDEQNRGLGGLIVSLFDYDCVFDNRLGTTQTDANGEFILTYRTQDFRDLLEAKPDLYLKILDNQGNTLYSSKSAIRCGASRVEVFEIRIQESDQTS